MFSVLRLLPALVLVAVACFACGDDGTSTQPDTGPSCTDGEKNGDETNRDCGGSCEPCAPGSKCVTATDCTSNVCLGGFCTMPSCTDEVKNGDELDVDCGGSCDTCAGGQVCTLPEDCASGVCQNGVCADTSCGDKELNVNETDVDCGGPDCAPCAAGGRCEEASDCESNVCQGGNCLAATCDDGQQNGDESDQDCGGSCDACNDGAMCNVPTDCQSSTCDRNRCISCIDGVQNGDETARDCGGSCDGCPAKQGCLLDSDCRSNLCINNACQNPGCEDDRTNAEETDVDCGGPDCDACADTKACSVNTDCASRVCDTTCQTPTCNDGVLNASEFDVDCGGTCGKCPDFRGCSTDADCQSGDCTASKTCTANCIISVGPDASDYRACLYTPTTLSCPNIASSGTVVTVPHNGSSDFITIGFPFEYYDRTFTDVAIQANGALTFTDEMPLPESPEPLSGSSSSSPRRSAPYDVVAIFWDSLRPNFDNRGTADPNDDLGVAGSNIRYQRLGTQPNRMFVVRWDTPVISSLTSQRGVFIGVLHENGEITACYEDTVFDDDYDYYNAGGSASVGLYTEDAALSVSHLLESVPSGTEVRYTPR